MTTITKPATSVKVEIQNQSFDISYPKSGEMIDIANLKSKLSDGQYSQLYFQRSNESDIALKLIDSFCFFTIMVPDLKKSLQIKSLYDLELFESTEIIFIYDSIIVPWLEAWTETINNRILELKGLDENPKKSMI